MSALEGIVRYLIIQIFTPQWRNRCMAIQLWLKRGYRALCTMHCFRDKRKTICVGSEFIDMMAVIRSRRFVWLGLQASPTTSACQIFLIDISVHLRRLRRIRSDGRRRRLGTNKDTIFGTWYPLALQTRRAREGAGSVKSNDENA